MAKAWGPAFGYCYLRPCLPVSMQGCLPDCPGCRPAVGRPRPSNSIDSWLQEGNSRERVTRHTLERLHAPRAAAIDAARKPVEPGTRSLSNRRPPSTQSSPDSCRWVLDAIGCVSLPTSRELLVEQDSCTLFTFTMPRTYARADEHGQPRRRPACAKAFPSLPNRLCRGHLPMDACLYLRSGRSIAHFLE